MRNFYRAFEDRYRGSRELIKERLKVYLAFVSPLCSLYSECMALDLGCGRGEWLELLQENGFQVQGVDLDDGMLDACQALDLPVEHCDALVKLKALPDDSLAVISGFHVAEHIPFSTLQEWVTEALRVLKPAGLLILETPNAENLVVGTNNFYLDPTHERPIPHLLLSFLTEHTGFTRSKLLRLQEAPNLRQETNIGLMQVLGGSSPDYGIVAQKKADEETMALFDQVFSGSYGLALGLLAERYDQGLMYRFKELEDKVEKTAEVCVSLNNYIDLQGGALRLMSDSSEERSSKHALDSAVVRYHNAELALSDHLVRAAQAEGKLANAQAKTEALQAQLHQVTVELLTAYKGQQKLTFTLDQERQQHMLSVAQLQRKVSQQDFTVSALEGRLAEREEIDRVKGENLQEAMTFSDYLQSQLNQVRIELQSSQAHAEQMSLEAHAQAARVNTLLNSTSWRITYPFRKITNAMRLLLWLPVRLIKAVFRPLISGLMACVLSRPELSQRISNRLRAYPRLHAHFRAFAVSRKLLECGEVIVLRDASIDERTLHSHVLADPELVVNPVDSIQEACSDEAVFGVVNSIDFNNVSYVRLFDSFIKKSGGEAHASIVHGHKKAIDDCSEK